MLKIKLLPSGVKHKHFYRIAVMDERKKLSAIPLDYLGFWYPAKENLKLDKEKLEKWLKKGAKLATGAQKLIK